jgi:hypothetical protein
MFLYSFICDFKKKKWKKKLPNFFLGYLLEIPSLSFQGFNISFPQGLGLRSSQVVN